MGHAVEGREKLIARIKRLQGQLGSVSEALERDDDCYKILQTLASARGALQGLMGNIVEGHIREHIVGADNAKKAHEAGEQTIEIMKSFWK